LAILLLPLELALLLHLHHPIFFLLIIYLLIIVIFIYHNSIFRRLINRGSIELSDSQAVLKEETPEITNTTEPANYDSLFDNISE